MYIWNIKKLRKNLETWLSEKDNAKYLIANIILYMISWSMIPYMITTYYWLEIMLIYFLLVIFWFIYTYKLNWWNNWKNYLSKYLSLSFVINIRWFVLFIVPTFIIYIILLSFLFFDNIWEYTENNIVSILDFIIQLFLYISYYILLILEFKKFKKHTQ